MAEEAAAVPQETSGFWFIEEVLPSFRVSMKLKSIGFNGKSAFQKVQVVETEPFGKTLVLDSKTQSALGDEMVYHESLVHPSLLMHGNPKSVYIGGGGELATAREVLKHKSVEKCVMVDLDKLVVDICREHLPEWNDGSTEDPRLDLHYDDAKAFLERYDGKFDVIIMDIADPIEAGPGIALYTAEFYTFVVSKLNPGGILVTQSGPGSAYNATECFSVIHQTLRRSFDFVAPYTADIPSFGSNWAFNMAFNKDCALVAAASAAGEEDPVRYLVEQPSRSLDEAMESRLSRDLRFMDGVAFKGIFGIPKSVRKALEEETRVMTVENPIFMY